MSGVPMTSFLVVLVQARLDVTHRVVAEVTGQPAGEARQTGQRCDLEARLVFLDEVQRIGDFLCGLACRRGQRDLFAAHREARFGGQADEGITPEAFATLHRFQQIGERFIGELEIQRQRRVEIGEGLDRPAGCGCSLAGQVAWNSCSVMGDSIKTSLVIFDDDGRTQRPVMRDHHRQLVVFGERSLCVM